ncbi:sensor histidine kinase [Tahibacter amnicola]|uniref:Sensor histidine kinase n=1 Tax=Tahibacter amnicola TaxID=2976241 RepID=A0ABY6BBY2_9GAMM|nr:sensor histidine kinase [Tahibacter amnicola]UXI67322.1 sensor histidine kinase [Tahibacter amnicola]
MTSTSPHHLILRVDVPAGTLHRLSPAHPLAPDSATAIDALLMQIHPHDRVALRQLLTESAVDAALDPVRGLPPDTGPCYAVSITALPSGERLAVFSDSSVDTALAVCREQAAQLQRRLEDVSLRLVNAQEEERRHIARELHDEIGQTLTAVVLNLEYRRDEPMPPADRMQALTDVRRTLAEVRDMSLLLRPPLLDDIGLEAALRWYLERQAAAGKMDTRLSVQGLERRPPIGIEITAYRLVQEAVTNIMRHARARHVDVALNATGHELAIRISDDGIGFDPREAMSDAQAGGSLGVIGMAERASLVGGHCEIVSMPGAGSIVLARLPLGSPAAPQG